MAVVTLVSCRVVLTLLRPDIDIGFRLTGAALDGAAPVFGFHVRFLKCLEKIMADVAVGEVVYNTPGDGVVEPGSTVPGDVPVDRNVAGPYPAPGTPQAEWDAVVAPPVAVTHKPAKSQEPAK